ncbi:type II toxin-antitoxin system Phd/YefM family antitoxin [Companilactobacillus allii]|uniref:Prevent-host-death protein n=1 Tax=Companilactobacillus allii TaxID=1847728 RepID=A0A1P8Q245_9LACO|nr:type II toxin-antitoxin system Phd/YefM family antitoxin [Companilactobacillus allii]APX71940.1 prevent-host-death protein [Companilactobacillus allii]USQ69034.1 type II toxin-antitoxin system Phd/YefM family antitoxin [Companilactobacillus allii]
MKILNVPTSNINELKKSPEAIFEESRKYKTGVYIHDCDIPVGVVISVQEYEKLVKENDRLQEEILDLEAANRLKQPYTLLSDANVRGDSSKKHPKFDEDDGWE